MITLNCVFGTPDMSMLVYPCGPMTTRQTVLLLESTSLGC